MVKKSQNLDAQATLPVHPFSGCIKGLWKDHENQKQVTVQLNNLKISSLSPKLLKRSKFVCVF